MTLRGPRAGEVLPPAKQVLPRQVLPFRGDPAGASAQGEDPLPPPPPGTQLEGSARRPDHRPEPGSGPRAQPGRVRGGSGSGSGGPAGRAPTFHLPDARLPPAGRVHAYLLCSGAARLSRSPGGRARGAGCRPAPHPAQPFPPGPGPRGRVTSFPGQFPPAGSRLPPPLRRRPRPGVLQTAPLTVQARCAVPPAGRQPDTAPRAGAAPLPGSPAARPARGAPGSAHAPVPLRRRLLRSGTGPRRRRQGGGRGARGAEPQTRSPQRGASGSRPARPSPAQPSARGPPAGRRAIERPLWQA